RFLDSLYFLVMKRRQYVWIGTAVVVVAMAIGAALYLRPEFYILDDIPQSDKIYKDLQYVEDKFDGAMPFEIVIDTKRKGGATKLRNLRQVNKLQRKIEQYPEISRTVSLVDVLKWGRQALMMGDRAAYQLPIREEYDFIQVYAAESKDYTTKAKGAKQNATEGGMMGAQLTDGTNQKLRISGFVRDIGASKMPELISRVDADMDSIFSQTKNPKLRLEGEVTGTSKIFLKTNKYLLDNLRITLVATLIIVCFQMLYLFRSWRIMLIAVAANLVPLLFTAGFMGFTGIPLKPSTMLIFQLSFSIAVDDCIHYLSMYRHERKTGASVQNAAGRTIRHTGLSIIYTSVVLFMGFMVFVPSAFGTTKYLGLLTAVTLMIAMFINLILVPALLMSFDTKKFDKDDGGLTAE
ncbi:MAG: efflux RND transporter permease subunit, partial [Bacteroidota bacterium]